MADTLTASEARLFADYQVPIVAGPDFPGDAVAGPVRTMLRPQAAPTAVSDRVSAASPARARLCPVVYARTYTRDRLGRFARVPGMTADEYHAGYGAEVNSYEVDDTDLTVRVFEDGLAHIVVEYTDEVDGAPMFDVLFDWNSSEEMRSAAGALWWAAHFPVPDEGDAGILASRRFGDGWFVGVDGEGLVSLIADPSSGPEFEAGVIRVQMDQPAALELSSGIYDMANEVDDIRDAEAEDDEYDDEHEEYEDDDEPMARSGRYAGRPAAPPAAARRSRQEPATGAMIALVPTDTDAARLAVGGGEPSDGLHLTLWYLGDAAAISEDNRAALATAVQSMVERRGIPPVEARAFGADLWNADSDKPAWVLGVGDLPPGERGPDQETLAVCRETMSEAWHDGGIALDVPPQHTPWQPHICVAYSADPALLGELVDRLGPVTFDRIRVAFAGETVDIPLTAPGKPTALPGEPAFGPSNTAVAAGAANRSGRLLPIRTFTEPITRGDLVGARTEARAARTRMRVQAKRKWFRIENKSSGTDIYLYGEVGYFGVTAADFCEELRRVKASTIDLHINSPGGQVYEGVAIYGALREHPATINVTVDGVAASAASFIACAGDRITIMRYAQMMIHDAWSDAYGNAEQLHKQADLLERTSVTIAEIYSRRAGGDAATWRALMKAETWFNAEEAVQFGLADDIGGDVLTPAAPAKSAWDLSVFAFPGRDRAPAPSLAMAMATPPEPETEPSAEGDGTPAGEPSDADTGAPDTAESAETAVADTEPVPPTDPATAPEAAQPVAWEVPAWTTEPADPWRSLVRGITTPEPSTQDAATAQEATQ